jgi:regulatory protein
VNITKIAPAVKTAGRYNLFVDGEYAFSLDESQLVTLALKVGQEISEVELADLKDESQLGKNYIRALDLLSRRPRSEREIRDYAFRKKWPAEHVERVIERLYKYGYLDDAKFAAAFVRSRAATRSFSRRKMILELRTKGIKPEIIDQVLADSDAYDELAALRRLVAKKQGSYDDQRKLIAYLSRQGFKYDDIKSVINK